MQLKNKTVLITGAGSGIGRALAQDLAFRGCHLALADINEEHLNETERLIIKSAIRISIHMVDVTRRSELDRLYQEVLEAHGGFDILINNAGIAAGGDFMQLSEDAFNKVMDVNFNAVVNLTRICLPQLITRPEARIVNISSLFGIITPPEQTAYCASKFAVRGFSNSLRMELRDTNVGVTVVHPGGINTNIARWAIVPEDVSEEEVKKRKAEEQKLLTMPPSKAAKIIVAGITRNKARVLVGTDARIISWLERLMPINNWKIIEGLWEKKKKS
ncbi:MAG: SDR family NAD(P)-dependent oxidoreductase [Saprospiraceae bacterium]|nr:SDR family NAD(P)-dependent oxidoreductase [Saprospiraceae bacterium]